MKMGNMQEEVYNEKLAELKSQMDCLMQGTLPEYVVAVQNLEEEYKKRVEFSEIKKNVEIQRAQRYYENQVKSLEAKFEEDKIELKETLLNQLEENRRQVEYEHHNNELNNDGYDVKAMPVRKLRRRANEPLPLSERKLKKSAPVVSYRLPASEVAEDLKKILGGSGGSRSESSSTGECGRRGGKDSGDHHGAAGGNGGHGGHGADLRGSGNTVQIESGKLIYYSHSYSRGQFLTLEPPNQDPVPVFIQNVSSREVCFRSAKDKKKIPVLLEKLQNGTYRLKPPHN